MNVGFDLDQVFINHPQFIPYKIVDWLHRGPQHNGPTYRFPRTKFEQSLRKFSHSRLFRPQISQNVAFLKELTTSKSPKLHLITSRYSFLEKKTQKLLKKYELVHLFTSVNLNLQNEQPHLFKERIINELELDLFIDDDLKLLKYLKSHCPKTQLVWYNPYHKANDHVGITTVHKLSQVEEFIK